MDLNLHLQNLPRVATNVDIRRFFNGLKIPEGGVQIIGGEDGDAFITFSLEEHLLKALMFDKQPLLGQPVNLFLAREADIDRVIHKRSKELEEARRRFNEGSSNVHYDSRSTALHSPTKEIEHRYRSSDVSSNAKELYDQESLQHSHYDSDSNKHLLRKRSPEHRSSSEKSKKRKEEDDFNISLPFHALATRESKKRERSHHSESSTGASPHKGHRSEDVPHGMAPWLREPSSSHQTWDHPKDDRHSHDRGYSSKDRREGSRHGDLHKHRNEQDHRRHGSDTGRDSREKQTSIKSRDSHSSRSSRHSENDYRERSRRDGSRHRYDSRERNDSRERLDNWERHDSRERSSSSRHRERRDRSSSRDRYDRGGNHVHGSSRDSYDRESRRSGWSGYHRDEMSERSRYSFSSSKHSSRYPLGHYAVYDLDVTVTATDLRKFFSGYKIPEGGIVLKSDPHDNNALIAYIACYPDDNGRSAAKLSGVVLHTRQVTVKLIPENLYNEHKYPGERLRPAAVLTPKYNQYHPLPPPPPMMYPGPLWRPSFPQPYQMPPMGYGPPPPPVYGPPPRFGPGLRYPGPHPSWASPHQPHGNSPPPRVKTIHYLRLEKLDKDSTAFGIWQSLNGEKGYSKNVTLISDPDNIASFAYVAYEDKEKRNDELDRRDVSEARARSYHVMMEELHNLDPGWIVIESTLHGNRDVTKRFIEGRRHDGASQKWSSDRSSRRRYDERNKDDHRLKKSAVEYSDSDPRRRRKDKDAWSRKRRNSESSISSTLSESPVSDFSGDEEEEEQDTTICVCARNFPLNISEGEIQGYFKEFNPIAQSARIQWEEEGQYASIKFKLDTEADAAIAALNQKMYKPLDMAHEERIIEVYRPEKKIGIKRSSKHSSKNSGNTDDKNSTTKKSGTKSGKCLDKAPGKQSSKTSHKNESKNGPGKHLDKPSIKSGKKLNKRSEKDSGNHPGKKSDKQSEKKTGNYPNKKSSTPLEKESENQACKKSAKPVEKDLSNQSSKKTCKPLEKESGSQSIQKSDKLVEKDLDKQPCKKLDKPAERESGNQSNKDTDKPLEKVLSGGSNKDIDKPVEKQLDNQLSISSDKQLEKSNQSNKYLDKPLEKELNKVMINDDVENKSVKLDDGSDVPPEKPSDDQWDKQTDSALNTESDIDIYGDLEESVMSDKETSISLGTADLFPEIISEKSENDCDELIADQADKLTDNASGKKSENDSKNKFTAGVFDKHIMERDTELSKPSKTDIDKQNRNVDVSSNSQEQSSDVLVTKLKDQKLADTAVDHNTQNPDTNYLLEQFDTTLDQQLTVDIVGEVDDNVVFPGSDSDIDIYAEIDE